MNHDSEFPLQMPEMPHPDHAAGARQRILLLKELPPFPMVAQRILRFSDERVDVNELAAIIEQDPSLSARLLGFANSAYFGWPGGVRTIRDAIYKVLGLKLVKSLTLSLILGGVFRTDKCLNFQLERYWFSAITTAIMAQSLLRHVAPLLRTDVENIYLNGLLYNLGLPVLTHVFPREMTLVFAGSRQDCPRPLADRARDALGIDQYTAGSLLARKWHLPRDIVHVIEHHHDHGYRGEFWPVVLLVGYCGRMAESLFTGAGTEPDMDVLSMLGIDEETAGREQMTMQDHMGVITDMATVTAGKGEHHG